MQSRACWDLRCEVINCSQNELLVIKTLSWQFWWCWGSGSNVDVPPREAARGEDRVGLKCRPLAGDARASSRSPGMFVGLFSAHQWVQGSSPSPYSWFPIAHASGEASHLVVSLSSPLCFVAWVLPRSQSTARAGTYRDPLPSGGVSLQQPPATCWLLPQSGKWLALSQLSRNQGRQHFFPHQSASSTDTDAEVSLLSPPASVWDSFATTLNDYHFCSSVIFQIREALSVTSVIMS